MTLGLSVETLNRVPLYRGVTANTLKNRKRVHMYPAFALSSLSRTFRPSCLIYQNITPPCLTVMSVPDISQMRIYLFVENVIWIIMKASTLTSARNRRCSPASSTWTYASLFVYVAGHDIYYTHFTSVNIRVCEFVCSSISESENLRVRGESDGYRLVL